MKLRNKKTGEIWDIGKVLTNDYPAYESLEQINEEWEDYEEPKEYWCINWTGGVNHIIPLDDSTDKYTKNKKEIGNYFETEEEAKKAVEKLKAWKRLKETNIDYKLSREYDDFTETMHANVSFSFNSYPLVGKDLGLLFGGEE